MPLNAGIILTLLGLALLVGSAFARQRLRRQPQAFSPAWQRGVMLASFAAYLLIILGLLQWRK